MKVRLLWQQPAFFVHTKDDGSNFQNGIGLGVEATTFDIHDYRQVATKAITQWAFC